MINQRKYIVDMSNNLGLNACKLASFPLITNLKLSTDQGDLLTDPGYNRRLIGKPRYLNLSKPNVSYAMQHLSQFLNQHRAPLVEAAIHVKYLKGTVSKGLFYPTSSTLSSIAYSDADGGYCLSSKRSLTGYCIYLGDLLVSWRKNNCIKVFCEI